MRTISKGLNAVVLSVFLSTAAVQSEEQSISEDLKMQEINMYTGQSSVDEVISDPIFSGFGRLIFPVNKAYYSGTTLNSIRLTWYSYIDPDNTVEIVNPLKRNASEGKQIFFDIYTEEEKKTDPTKRNTGLFFFKGKPQERFAICNSGGGFVYV